MLDKITLMALGINPNTDPNNPNTWSDELKINHKRVLSSLGDNADRVQVKPSEEVTGRSGSFVAASKTALMYGEEPSPGIFSASDISQTDTNDEYEDEDEILSNIDLSDLQDLGTAPKGVDKTEWSKLPSDIKEKIQEYITLHRLYSLNYERNGKLPSEDYLKEASGRESVVSGWNRLGYIIGNLSSRLGEQAFDNGERVVHKNYEFDPRDVDEYDLQPHIDALGSSKIFKLLGKSYPIGFGKQHSDDDEDEPITQETFRAQTRKASKKELDDFATNENFEHEQDKPQGSSSSTKSYSDDDEDEYYDDEDGYSDDDDEDYSDDSENTQSQDSSTSTMSSEAQAEQDKAVDILWARATSFGPKTTTAAVLQGALGRVKGNIAKSGEEERARITDILNDELSKQKKGSIMHAHLELAAKKYAEDTVASASPTVQEQNQAQTESGSNVSAQMTEAGVAPGQTPQRLVTTTDQNGHPNILYTAPNGATSEQRAVYGPNKEHVGHVTIWKDSQGNVKGIMGPYDFKGVPGQSPLEDMQGMAKLQSENLDKSIKKTPALYDGTVLKRLGAPLKDPSNEQLYKQVVNPTYDENEEEENEETAQQSAVEPETPSYSGPGSVEYANKEDAPTSGGAMPDGSAPTWKDVHIAITNGTKRTSSPGAKRYIRKVAPDLGGHVLDISDTFYAIQNHPDFTPEAKESAINEIKSGAQPIYDWIKGKAESTPDEVATGLPRSLRQDQMVSDYQGIIARKNTKVDESTGLSKEAQDVYAQSAEFAELARFQGEQQGKLGPADVVYGNKTRNSIDSRGKSYGTSRSDMTSEQYEAWAAQKKSEGWTDWRAEKPMSSEDLAAQKKAASASRTKSIKIPKAGSSYSSTLPKEERFDSDLRPTNVDKDHWTALKTYHPQAAAFVSMYAHKWHNLVDSGTIAPEGNASTGETPRYTVDQLKSDKQAVLNMFSPRMAGAVHNGANNDKLYKLAPLLSSTKGHGLVDTDHDAADRINHILRAYPMPE